MKMNLNKRIILVCVCAIVSLVYTRAQTYTLGLGESAILNLPNVSPAEIHFSAWTVNSSAVKFLSKSLTEAEIIVVEPFNGTVIVEAVYSVAYIDYNTGQHTGADIFEKEFKIKCSSQMASNIAIPESISINVFEEYKFSPTVSPLNAVTDFFWSMGNGDVDAVKLDYSTGVIQGVSAGIVEIILTDMYTLRKAHCQVTVVDPDAPTAPPAIISERALNATLDKLRKLLDITKEHSNQSTK